MTEVPVTPNLDDFQVLLILASLLLIIICGRIVIAFAKTNYGKNRLVNAFSTYFLLIVVTLVLANVYLIAPMLLPGILKIIYYSTPLEVVYSYPYDEGVPRNIPITIRFNIPLDNTSISTESLKLFKEQGNRGIEGTINAPFDIQSPKIVFNPSIDLEPNTKYYYTLDTDGTVKDISGKTYVESKYWTFTTGTGVMPEVDEDDVI